jgi:hypothetical protein
MVRARSDVRAKIRSRFVVILLVCCGLVLSTWLAAQWRPSPAPRDYEQCSESALRATSSKDERALAVTECDKQFTGRRRAGGGYTYYDFLQDRHFDIVGPNPTPEELKSFDEAYVAYLNAQPRDPVAASPADTQRQKAEAAFQADRSSVSPASPVGPPLVITPVPMPRPGGQIARSKARRCEDESLSCKWTKFSAGMQGFFDSYAKANRP